MLCSSVGGLATQGAIHRPNHAGRARTSVSGGETGKIDSHASATRVAKPATELPPGSQATVFGDSITVGVGISPTLNSYPNLVAKSRSWSLTNAAVSGSELEDAGQMDKMLAQTVTSSFNYFGLFGYNNMRHWGAGAAGGREHSPDDPGGKMVWPRPETKRGRGPPAPGGTAAHAPE